MLNHRKVGLFAATMLLGAHVLNAGGPASAVGTVDTVVGTITTTAKPTSVKVSTDGTKVFVAFYSDAMVQAYDVATGSLVWTATVGNNPLPLEVSPDGLWVYVMDNGPDFAHLSRISAATGIVDQTVLLSSMQPWDSTLSADGTTLYVADGPSTFITRVDLATAFTPGKSPADYEITKILNHHVNDVELSADGSVVYLPLWNNGNAIGAHQSSDLGFVRSFTQFTSYCPDLNKFAVSPDDKFMYVTCSAYDTNAGLLIWINLADPAKYGFHSLDAVGDDVVVSPDSAKVYVTHGDADFLTVLDVATGALSHVAGVPNAAFGLAFNPLGNRAFAATWGGIAANTYVKQIDTGVIPNAQLTDPLQTCAATMQQGTAPRLETLTSTTTLRKGTAIYKSITPSTFLYWARVTLPATTPTTVLTQSVNVGTVKLLGTRGSVLYDQNCAVVKTAKFTYGTDGSATVAVPAAGTYFAAVKFATTTLTSTTKQDRVFTFASNVGPWWSPRLRLA